MKDVAIRASREVNAASGAIFRIGFGFVGLLLVIRFFAHDWIGSLLIDPTYHFSYPGFEWVSPWPGRWMYVHFLVIGLAAVGIGLGYRYRLSASVFALSLAYVELIDRTLYLNHYYWLVLTAAVMVFLPLNATFSLDAGAGRVRSPGAYPAWVVWVLRFQVGMVYFFAGMAKINSDWLLRAEPLATWLQARSDLWLIGPVLTIPAIAFMLSWAGAFFDLTIVGWLSWPKARGLAYVILIMFHAMTWVLFPSIGLFPLLMSLAALVFFDPEWPGRVMRIAPLPTGPEQGRRPAPGVVILTAAYVLVMVALPARHYAIAGDVKWTGEGYLGSWQVMLSEKSGSADFIVSDPASGATWRVPPPNYLTDRQLSVLATDPILIRLTAELIARDIGGVEVAADVRLSFNGRPSAQFTDPEVVIAGTGGVAKVDGFIAESPTG